MFVVLFRLGVAQGGCSRRQAQKKGAIRPLLTIAPLGYRAHAGVGPPPRPSNGYSAAAWVTAGSLPGGSDCTPPV